MWILSCDCYMVSVRGHSHWRSSVFCDWAEAKNVTGCSNCCTFTYSRENSRNGCGIWHHQSWIAFVKIQIVFNFVKIQIDFNLHVYGNLNNYSRSLVFSALVKQELCHLFSRTGNKANPKLAQDNTAVWQCEEMDLSPNFSPTTS